MSSVLNYEPDKSGEIMRDAETVLSPFIYNAKQNYRYIREVTFYPATARPAFRSIIRPRSEFNISEFRKSNNGDFNWFYNEKMIILSRAIVMEDEYKGDLTNNFDNMIRHINRLIEDIRESEHIQKKAELKALQAQIKPHFLYNVLQAVNWNAIDKGDTETSLIVVNLSNFYRAVLNKGDDDISVEKELKIVEYYINVEKAIYGDIFKVAYNIDEGIKNCLAIPLILQPLVENAIEHGIRSLAEPHGEIVVSAYAEGGTLVFTVSDNGAGIPPQKTDTILTKATSGYGLKNINERIKLRFGEEYGLRLTSPPQPYRFYNHTAAYSA